MKDPALLLRRLAGRRLLARAALLFELVWPALWPASAVIGLFLCAALLGLPPLLPGWLHLIVLGTGVAPAFRRRVTAVAGEAEREAREAA